MKRQARFRSGAKSTGAKRLLAFWIGVLALATAVVWMQRQELLVTRASGGHSALPHAVPGKATSAGAALYALAGDRYAARVVSNSQEREITLALAAAVPGLEEVYVQKLAAGGVAIVATATLRGYPHIYAVAADASSRFLLAAYRLPGVKVDFAALYTEEQGRYVMVVGLGAKEAQAIALETFAPDEGLTLTRDLQRINRFASPYASQAFAQYQGL
ncbi:MAG: hypothetical protein ACYCYO_06585 [Bacilli bacterium]